MIQNFPYKQSKLTKLKEYEKKEDLENDIKNLFTTIFDNTDYLTFLSLNTYLNILIPVISPPVFITLTDVGNENDLYSCNYQNNTVLSTYHYRTVFCFLTRTKNNKHFDHLYLFRSRGNSNDVGDTITQVFNFFPNGIPPYIFKVGDETVILNNTLYLRLLIGDKIMDITFNTISQMSNKTVCYHVKLINANFDNIVGRLYPTGSTPNPNVYNLEDEDLEAGSFFKDTTKAYYEYDYLTENDYLLKHAYDVNKSQYHN